MAGLALVLFLAGYLLPFSGDGVRVAARLLLWLGFPIGLFAMGALERREIAAVAGYLRAWSTFRSAESASRGARPQ
jgi:hypothetical protein